MDKINQYLDIAVAGIRNRHRQEDVRLELEDYIMEKYDEYIARGYNEEESEEKTVNDMGDAYDLRDQMGKLHSFVPHVYFNHAVLFLLFGLLFTHFNFTINEINLFHPLIGMALMEIAFFRFYRIGTKSKIAFWIYSAVQLISIAINVFGVNIGINIFDSSSVSVITEQITFAVIITLVLAFIFPTCMTLLCLDLLKKDDGHDGLKWVIGVEWAYFVLFALALTGLQTFVLAYMGMVVGLIVELVILGKFSIRASRLEWNEKKGLHVSIPIIMAVVYVITSCLPYICNFRLNTWVPDNSKVLIGEQNGKWFLHPDDLTGNTPENLIYQTQYYWTKEDERKLESCENLRMVTQRSANDWSIIIMTGYNETNTYFIYLYYFSSKSVGSVCQQKARVEKKNYTIQYHHFYRTAYMSKNNEFTTEGIIGKQEQEYFYVLQNRESFGYTFIEVDGVDDYYGITDHYMLQIHKSDTFHPEITSYSTDWKTLCLF